MTKFPIMRLKFTIATRIVSELNVVSDRDGKTFDEVVSAAILAFSEASSNERASAYVRSRIREE